MAPASLLVTFLDAEELGNLHASDLGRGRCRVWGEYELTAGDVCELVFVHPDSGETMEIDGKVDTVEEDNLIVLFGITPLVRNRLNKFVGVADGTSIQARVRLLKGNQRRQLALTGDLTERTALERAFGKEVWDALIENPRLTVGEVVRLARMGSMPLPLVDKIMANNSWVKIPQIRRALFSNRRLDSKMISRLLRFTPASELRLIPEQTAYPASVRTAARRLMGRK